MGHEGQRASDKRNKHGNSSKANRGGAASVQSTGRETKQKQHNHLDGDLAGVPATGLALHHGLSTKEESGGEQTPYTVEKGDPATGAVESTDCNCIMCAHAHTQRVR